MTKVIMTVDDSASVRQMVSFTLKQAGYDVVEAVDGEDALGKLQSGNVNMLVTDLNMPGESGLAVTRNVRDAGSAVPVIIFSGSLVAGEEVRAEDAGANLVLPKPSGIPMLRKAVCDYLGIES